MQEVAILIIQVMGWCSTCHDGSTALIPEAKLTDRHSILTMLISQAKSRDTVLNKLLKK